MWLFGIFTLRRRHKQYIRKLLAPRFDTCCFLSPSAGIAVGFYGNGESSDGANRLAYSLRHANRTVSGVEKLVSCQLDCLTFDLNDKPPTKHSADFTTTEFFRFCLQVSDNAQALNQTVEENLVQLETTFQDQTDFVAIVQKLQGQLDELVRLMVDVPFWSNTDISLEDLAQRTEAFDFYRCVETTFRKDFSWTFWIFWYFTCG